MITRKEAEKVVRKVMANHAGEKFEKDLFKDSVDKLMKEMNTTKEAEQCL